jgi:hypothetical protein
VCQWQGTVWHACVDVSLCVETVAPRPFSCICRLQVSRPGAGC